MAVDLCNGRGSHSLHYYINKMTGVGKSGVRLPYMAPLLASIQHPSSTRFLPRTRESAGICRCAAWRDNSERVLGAENI